MKCKAKYIGPQGDCSYEFNQVYKIKIEIHHKMLIVESKHNFPKAYSSFARLLQEWKFVNED